ncbi:MAG: potassium channel family protein [Acidimicrobiales bacterium]
MKRARAIITHRGFHFVLLAAFLLVLAMAALELASEHGTRGATIHNYSDAPWWALVTVSTVAYGDKVPVAAGGRAIAVVLMFVGIGLMGTITATVASFFAEETSGRDNRQMQARLDKIETTLAQLFTSAPNASTLSEPSVAPAASVPASGPLADRGPQGGWCPRRSAR